MQDRIRLPKPRLPAPSELTSPLVSIENAVISAIQAPFRAFGLPVPPTVPGPVSVVNQVISQLPAPPQPPDLPVPRFPRLAE